ncbi:olfactory receptor 1019-like [Bufo gargarizans]|uniref:olfactory receptor 1019-like n=1 Tax=Bufo gargarizans TaxID=30331 RepID=UPI001CF48028|nr:olfactory receptor 1019-like [Bufo gargarizans]
MNKTTVNFFVITGITHVPVLKELIFFLVLLIYLLTVAGNMTIFLLICLDRQLHSPMYFFLGNLSILDISCSTIATHKILSMFVTGNDIIYFPFCMAQLYLFSSFTSIELLLLTAMSYDRYVAICRPLYYSRIMNPQACLLLALACWLVGFIELIPYMDLLLRISCYRSNIINHFFCDMMPIIKMSCSDTSALELLIFTEGVFLLSVTPFLLTFISYMFIISSIMRIRYSTGRRKTFYTCSSHLTVVVLLYGTLFCQYLRPTTMDTLDSNKIFSLFNTVAVPVLNPIIYSLKNKTVKSALKQKVQLYFKIHKN